MKKRYTKRQMAEAIAYWKRQLAKGNYRKVNESDKPGASGMVDALQLVADRAGVTVEQLIHAAICKVNKKFDIRKEGCLDGITYSPRNYTLFLDFSNGVEGSFEDYGIGAYEYWGSGGYDSRVGFEIDSGGLDRDRIADVSDAVAEALFGEGAEYDMQSISDDIDPDDLTQYGNSTIRTDYE